MVSHRTLLMLIITATLVREVKADQPPLVLLTEATPFTLTADNSGNGGEATAFVKQLLDNAQLDYELTFEPWKRAYRKAQSNDNVLIYPIARDAAREKQFRWIGQLIPVTYYLFRLTTRDNINVVNLADAKKWKIGVVNEHIHHQFLKDKGFENLQAVNSNYQNIQKALLGRIDLFPMSDGGLMQLCSRDNLDCSSFKPILRLDGISNGLYLAAALDSDQKIIQKLNDSYQNLLANGQHEQVLRQRLLRIEESNLHWPNQTLTVDATNP